MPCEGGSPVSRESPAKSVGKVSSPNASYPCPACIASSPVSDVGLEKDRAAGYEAPECAGSWSGAPSAMLGWAEADKGADTNAAKSSSKPSRREADAEGVRVWEDCADVTRSVRVHGSLTGPGVSPGPSCSCAPISR